MFTPQRKGFPGWSISPRSEVPRSVGAGSVSANRKGKSVVAAIEGPLGPPPLASLGDKGGDVGGGDVVVWQRFREEGLLDEAALERKDREALSEKLSKLHQEVKITHFSFFPFGLVGIGYLERVCDVEIVG